MILCSSLLFGCLLSYYILFVQCLLYQTVNELAKAERFIKVYFCSIFFSSRTLIPPPYGVCVGVCVFCHLKERTPNNWRKWGGKNEPNKIQNSKCEKLSDAQAHAYKHMHNANTRKKRTEQNRLVDVHVGVERMCKPGKMRKL